MRLFRAVVMARFDEVVALFDDDLRMAYDSTSVQMLV